MTEPINNHATPESIDWEASWALMKERAEEAERRIAAVVTEGEAIRADCIAFWGAHSSADIARVGREPRMPKTPALDRERAALRPVAETAATKGGVQ